jgi:hypothetical protein
MRRSFVTPNMVSLFRLATSIGSRADTHIGFNPLHKCANCWVKLCHTYKHYTTPSSTPLSRAFLVLVPTFYDPYTLRHDIPTITQGSHSTLRSETTELSFKDGILIGQVEHRAIGKRPRDANSEYAYATLSAHRVSRTGGDSPYRNFSP